MRGVLRTLAQCHKRHILHRDVKPGNFLLLNNKEDAPIKAIGRFVFVDALKFLRVSPGLVSVRSSSHEYWQCRP